MLLASVAWADVEVADSADDVKRFLEENQDNTVALFFIDSSLNEGSEGGFWKGIVTSVSHIFAGDQSEAGSQQRVAEIEKEISNEAALMQIDVSNEDLREIQESYDVSTVPFLIVFKRGIVVLKEVPTHETHDKILQVLNVNPASVHNEETIEIPVETEQGTIVVEAIPVSSEAPAPESKPVEESVAVDAPKPAEESVAAAAPAPAEEPVAAPAPEPIPVPTPTPVESVQPKPTASGKPLEPSKAFAVKDESNDEEEVPALATFQLGNTTLVVEDKHITLAPGEKEARKPQVQERPASTNVKREFIHHQCHDITTFDDGEAKNWRNSPFYIAELEDYELPEDWWRNGYSALENNTESRSRTVAFSEAEVIVFEPSSPPRVVVPVAPVIIRPEPVHRPAPVRIAEPVLVAEPRVRAVAPEPRFVPQRYVSKHLATNATVTAHGTGTTAGGSRTSVRATTGDASAPTQVSRREVPSQKPSTTISGQPTITTTPSRRAGPAPTRPVGVTAAPARAAPVKPATTQPSPATAQPAGKR